MRILLANDDGIQADGLRIIGEELSKIADVFVAAPAIEQSGTGHGLTIRKPLQVEEYQLPFAVKAWKVHGLPADCVKIGIEELIKNDLDMVVSGINHGPNLGTDVIYSGTVSAAMEGLLYGYPALAVSVMGQGANYQAAAEFAAASCLKWQKKNFLPKTLLNINVPGLKPDDILGKAYATLGWRWYENVFNPVPEQGENYYWLGGDLIDTKGEGNTDVEVFNRGYISITPLFSDLTNYRILDQLQGKDDIFAD